MNKIFLTGYVFVTSVRFIECEKTEFMQFYLSFRIGGDKKYSQIKCVCFGDVAKKINNKVSKMGDDTKYFKAFVEGKLSEEEYNEVKKLYIVAKNVNIIG